MILRSAEPQLFARDLGAAHRAARLQFQQELRREPWGARSFTAADPDGKLLAFAGK
jgi:hypothetical protein